MKPLVLARPSGSNSQPAVRKAVNQLRRECVMREAGTLLGQEEELLRRFGISRPTLRQAATLLTQEQLMEVRRGPGGGYYTNRPDISVVVHMAAIWLQLQHVKVSDILLSTTTIRAELAPLAARNIDDEGREVINAFLEEDRAIADSEYEYQNFLKAELQQNQIVGNLASNRVLHLYMQISLDLAGSLSRSEDILFEHRSRYLKWRHHRNRMLDAIAAGDPEIARLEAERCAERMRKWVETEERKRKKAGEAAQAESSQRTKSAG